MRAFAAGTYQSNKDHLIRGAVLSLLFIFWSAGLWNLDRFPTIHNDEPAILAPGYKLFRHGVFGSDLYAGFQGQGELYLEAMPLMPILQGFSAWLFGVGIWQMRFLPLMAGTIILTLTFTLARKITSAGVGMLAVLVLLFWQWTPRDAAMLGSGIPMVDVSRIARYDILVPVFGLGAFWSWIQARQTGRRSYDFLSGLLVGLSTLSNLYGLFWLFALGPLLLLDARHFSSPPVWRSLGWMVLGAIVVISIWGVVIILNWNDFLGQFSKHQGRFSLFSAPFYLNNLLGEIHRYQLGLDKPASLTRLGFWLVAVGIPGGLLWLGKRAWRQGDRQALWLLVPCLVFLIFIALLISKKKFAYLITVIPLLAIMIAWGLDRLRQGPRLAGRFIAMGVIALLMVQGSWGIIAMQANAGRMTPPAIFFATLEQALPPEARVTGPLHYWFANPERAYRDFGLAFILASPKRPNPISFGAALEQLEPQIVLLTPLTEEWLSITDQLEPLTPPRRQQFWGFMARHRAKIIAELADYNGDPVRIYELEW